MYTATKLEFGLSEGRAYQCVQYVDGKSIFPETYYTDTPSDTWPETIIASRLAILNALDLTKLTTGAPRPLPAPVPLGQAELDKAAFFVLYRKLQNSQQLITTGVIKVDDQPYLDLQAAVKAAYKPEYFA